MAPKKDRAKLDTALEPGALRGATPVPTPPGFVRPELATLVDRAPAGEDWLHEIKFDGYRAIASIDKGAVTMYSRNEKEWTEPFAAVVDELVRLPVQSAVLDGEVAVVLPDGRTGFQELREALGAGQDPAREEGVGSLVYFIFDLLHLDGYDLTQAALEDRKDLLRRLLVGENLGGRLRYLRTHRGRRNRRVRAGLPDAARGHREQTVRQPVPPGSAQRRMGQDQMQEPPGVRHRRVHGARRSPDRFRGVAARGPGGGRPALRGQGRHRLR